MKISNALVPWNASTIQWKTGPSLPLPPVIDAIHHGKTYSKAAKGLPNGSSAANEDKSLNNFIIQQTSLFQQVLSQLLSRPTDDSTNLIGTYLLTSSFQSTFNAISSRFQIRNFWQSKSSFISPTVSEFLSHFPDTSIVQKVLMMNTKIKNIKILYTLKNFPCH